MELRRDFLIGVGILIGLNLLLAFVGVGLLNRVSPSVQAVIRENINSIEAVEEILAVLASAEGERSITPSGKEMITSAIDRARKNISEPQEEPVIGRILGDLDATLAGDSAARSRLTENLVELSSINRRAISHADTEARRLGLSGAWAAVFLAIASLLISFVVIVRLERRMVLPFVELSNVLKEFQSGNRDRRCHLGEGPSEVREVFELLNGVLDGVAHPSVEEEEADADFTRLDRIALIHFLSGYGRPALIVDTQGQIVASNQEALVSLSEPEGGPLRAALNQLLKDGTPPESIEAIRLKDAGWLCIQERPRR